FGNGGEPIGTLDRELRDRAEQGILPNERDVRTVERRDDADGASRLLEHLAGDPGAGGVRDGVVRVHQLELVIAHDFVQAHGESEVVWRVLEQRVAYDIHLVKKDSGGEGP